MSDSKIDKSSLADSPEYIWRAYTASFGHGGLPGHVLNFCEEQNSVHDAGINCMITNFGAPLTARIVFSSLRDGSVYFVRNVNPLGYLTLVFKRDREGTPGYEDETHETVYVGALSSAVVTVQSGVVCVSGGLSEFDRGYYHHPIYIGFCRINRLFDYMHVDDYFQLIPPPYGVTYPYTIELRVGKYDDGVFVPNDDVSRSPEFEITSAEDCEQCMSWARDVFDIAESANATHVQIRSTASDVGLDKDGWGPVYPIKFDFEALAQDMYTTQPFSDATSLAGLSPGDSSYGYSITIRGLLGFYARAFASVSILYLAIAVFLRFSYIYGMYANLYRLQMVIAMFEALQRAGLGRLQQPFPNVDENGFELVDYPQDLFEMLERLQDRQADIQHNLQPQQLRNLEFVLEERVVAHDADGGEIQVYELMDLYQVGYPFFDVRGNAVAENMLENLEFYLNENNGRLLIPVLRVDFQGSMEILRAGLRLLSRFVISAFPPRVETISAYLLACDLLRYILRFYGQRSAMVVYDFFLAHPRDRMGLLPPADVQVMYNEVNNFFQLVANVLGLNWQRVDPPRLPPDNGADNNPDNV